MKQGEYKCFSRAGFSKCVPPAPLLHISPAPSSKIRSCCSFYCQSNLKRPCPVLELLIIFGLPCTLKNTHFLQQPMKGFETGVCQNRQWWHCRLTLIDSDILNKKVSDLPKSMFWLKTRTFILYDLFSSRTIN